MEYYDEPPAGVDPYALARASGLLPNFGLHGMGLNTDATGTALTTAAEIDPEPISKAALTIIATIEGFFGAGKGRMEADQITPIQAKITTDVIAPIVSAIKGPNASSLSTQQLQAMWNILESTKASWLNMLHTTQWSDGRAAQQAEAGMAPYFSDQEARIQELLKTSSFSISQAVTGVPGLPGLVTTGPSGISTTNPALTAGFGTILPVAIGVLALIFLMPKLRK